MATSLISSQAIDQGPIQTDLACNKLKQIKVWFQTVSSDNSSTYVNCSRPSNNIASSANYAVTCFEIPAINLEALPKDLNHHF